jgi:DCN1-like protein 1/2
VSREAGQRNLSVETALLLWPLLLEGRFRLLDRWCAFVAATRRLGITEDTWRQVLDFSRLVHEDLSNYDPEARSPDARARVVCSRGARAVRPRAGRVAGAGGRVR